MNETGWLDPDISKRRWSLCNALMDSDIKRPTQLILIAEGMGWPSYGIGYTDGNEVDNENAPVISNGSDEGNKSKFPPVNEDIPLNGGTAGKFGGTKCKVYNLRVSHRETANLLIYDGHVKNMSSTTGRNWGNYY
ncbi:MAG: hypothetical protein Q7N50_03195 [Armatimonadota bacterium]|nr:hypothetical protein [Armatimonadota bacterium]